MTTETIDIRIREDGSRVVKRSLQEIGGAAEKSANQVDFLRNMLKTLVGFLAVDKIRQYADAWASASGSIRIATKSQEQAIAVQEELFKAAQNTRQGFTDIVELYARTARAGKELGASQAQIIQFTEGVGKSLAVQHTSAEQARGALLQLGQALGGGVVRAEEFNSILEGAPYILQVVAKNLDGMDGSVTKLRKRMLDGKLTSKEFFDAFLKGSKDIDADFAKSSLTISQGITLITNALTKYIGQLDEAIGFSHAFGEAAKFVANNLASIIAVIGSVSLGVATYFGLLKAAQFASAVAGQLQFVAAVAQGKAVMLGSAEAAAQMAVAQTAASLKAAQAAEAELAATQATNIAKLRSSVTLAEAKVAEVAATQAALVVAREEAVAKLAAANANIQQARATIAAAESAGALSFALATARAATQELTVAEATRAAALRELALLGQQQARVSVLTTEALAAQTTATRALTAAQTQGAQAAAAANAATASAAGAAAAATTKAAAASTALSRTLSALGLGALANPWILLAAALVTVIALIYKFGDAINVGLDDYTSLLDLFRALGSYAVEGFRALKDAASAAFSTLGDIAKAAYESITGETDGAVGKWISSFTGFYDDVGGGFAGLVKGAAKTVDAITGLFLGGIIAMVRSFTGLPGLIGNIFKQVYNQIVEWVEKALNGVINAVNKIRGAIGASLLETVSLTRADVDTDAFEKYGQGIMSAIDDGFKAEGGVFLKSVEAVFNRAQEIGLQRAMEANVPAPNAGLNDKMGPGGPPPVDEKAAKALEKLKNELRSLLSSVAPAEAALLELSKAHNTLDKSLAAGLITQEQYSKYLSILYEQYESLLDPVGAMNQQLDLQAKLLNMSADAREIETQFLSIQNDLIQKGVKLTNEEALAIRAKLIELRQLNAVVQQQDALLAQSVEKRKAFDTQIQAMKNLLADPTSGFTKGDSKQAILDSTGDLFQGTQLALDAQAEGYKRMYEQIQKLREADLISEEEAAQARQRLAIKSNETRLQQADSFFGNMATLSSSGNKTLARIGKAAAITQATIQGYVAVQNALAVQPYPVGIALAVGAATVAAGNIANIVNAKEGGYMTGGYTGNGGVREVAGFVHGQEFVMNAETTRRNRPALEAMHAGADFSELGGGMKVSIENYGTSKEFEVQQLSRDEVRVIARDEVRKVAPEVIASEFSNPNSRVSASANRNLQGGGRKRA